jgi:hypothetical protein
VKRKSALFAVLSIVLGLFTFALPVLATASPATNNVELSMHAPLPTLNNIAKLDPTLPNETILGSGSNQSELLNSQNVKILSSYGVNTQNVSAVKEERDNINDRNISEIQFNNIDSVDFDDNNNIISIANFKDDSNLSSKSVTASVGNEVYANSTSVSSQVYLNNLISKIEANNNFTGSYKLVSSEAYDDSYWQLDWEKDLGNGVLNPYDALKVGVNRNDNSVAVYNRFNMTPNTTQPVISESEALTAAKPVLDTISNVQNKVVSLTVTRPNYFWNDGGPYKTADIARLAYQISVNNGAFLIYIDAVTGENLGGDESQSENGKAYALAALTYGQASANLAYNGMSGLGYHVLPSYVGGGAGMGTDILNYWNGSASYAFYIDCHGNPTTIGDGDAGQWALSTTSVVGNWHFVFLNACSTAVNAGWANAFKVNGYSKRAFLGWSTDVYEYPVYEFATFFWPEAVNRTHSNNIKDAAVWAASQVPGQGSTPIRFYGDTTYNGRAWS